MDITLDSEKAFGHVEKLRNQATKTKVVAGVENSTDEQHLYVLRGMVEKNVARFESSIEDLEDVYKSKPSVELYNTLIVLREAHTELKKVKIR